MSGTYRGVLPSVFPWRALVPQSVVGEIAAVLSDWSSSTPNGSSFAVTSDTPRTGYRWLWMSEASHKYMAHYHDNKMLDVARTEEAE
jgi:hypothetical protein